MLRWDEGEDTSAGKNRARPLVKLSDSVDRGTSGFAGFYELAERCQPDESNHGRRGEIPGRFVIIEKTSECQAGRGDQKKLPSRRYGPVSRDEAEGGPGDG